MDIGYIRLSTTRKLNQKQLTDLSSLATVYIDITTARENKVDAKEQLLNDLRDGDCVHVQRFDRFARSFTELSNLLAVFRAKKVDLRFHEEGWFFPGDPAHPAVEKIARLVNALARWEQTLKAEKAENAAAARRTGRPNGRPSSNTEAQRAAAENAFRVNINASLAQVSRETGVPKTTCLRIRNRLKAKAQAESEETP